MVGMTLYLQEKKKVLLRVGSVSISVALWISHLIGLFFFPVFLPHVGPMIEVRIY